MEFWREAEILSRLHHPNVVAFYGVVEDGPGATLATVTEFMVNGSLRNVLLRNYRYFQIKVVINLSKLDNLLGWVISGISIIVKG